MNLEIDDRNMILTKKVSSALRDKDERIKELEEILCPCQQHDWIELESRFVIDSGAPIVDGHTEGKYICKRCKKIMFDSKH